MAGNPLFGPAFNENGMPPAPRWHAVFTFVMKLLQPHCPYFVAMVKPLMMLLCFKVMNTEALAVAGSMA